MEPSEIGTKIGHALELQGKVDAFEREIDAIKDQIRNNEDELRKLRSLEATTGAARTKLVHLEAELAGTNSSLISYLGELRKEGIELPLGKGTKQTTL